MADLIFDIDGTIWDTTDIVAESWNRAARESGLKEENCMITGDILKKEFGKPMDVIAEDLFGNLNLGKETIERIMELCCDYEQHDIEDNDKNLTYDGIISVMRELSKNHKLFIVSNCQSGYIELVMKKNGIEDIISDFVCFGDNGLQKGENIKLIMDRNNLSDAYYVGDAMGDFLSTREAGAKFIFASYGFGDVPDPDFIINSPNELKDILI